MQLRELRNVLDDLDLYFKKHNLSGHYSRLNAALNQARKKPSPEATAKINQLKEKIRSAHEAAQSEQWNHAGRKVYEKLGAAELLGRRAMSRIDQIFQSNQADPGGIAQALGDIADRTGELVEHVRALMTGLEPFTEGEPEPAADGTTLQLIFAEAASTRTMRELEEALGEWNRVLLAFYLMVKQSEDDALIVNIQPGPLVIEMTLHEAVALALGRAACEVLSVYEKYLNIKKVGLEVSGLELRNNAIVNHLDKEAEILIKSAAKDVTDTLLDGFLWKSSSEKSEVHNHVKPAIMTVFQLVRDGGRISIGGTGKEEIEVQSRLDEAFTRVRHLGEQIEQLAQPESDGDKPDPLVDTDD